MNDESLYMHIKLCVNKYYGLSIVKSFLKLGS
jgi:hypothetical protein